MVPLRLDVIVVFVSLHLLAWAQVVTPLTGHFNLADDAFVSAGVALTGGSEAWRLVRTLWSRRFLPAGQHAIEWDGLDDEGQPPLVVAGSVVSFHVLAFNTTYTWEGVVGNDVAQTGPTVPKGYNPPQAMAIAGDVAVLCTGYAERVRSMFAFNASAPPGTTAATFISLGHMDYHRVFSYCATDGRTVAFADRSPVVPQTSYYYLNLTFIAGWDVGGFVAGDRWCEHNYTAGGAPSCEEGFGQGPCQWMWDGCGGHEQTYSSVIDAAHDPTYTDGEYSDAATGLAMQCDPGSLLLAAHGHKASLRAFDKTSGAPVRNWTDGTVLAGVRSLAVAAGSGAADLDGVWAVTDSGVVRLAGLSGTGPLRVTLRLDATTLGAAGAIALSPDGSTLLVTDVDPASQQVKRFDASTGALQYAYGAPGGYLAPGSGISVAPTRFWFSPPVSTNAFGSMPVPASYVAWTPDGGSFWLSDWGNRRMLRLAVADGSQLDSLAWLLSSYASAVPAAEPTRVFSNFLEFRVNYSLPPGVPGAWELVANWGAGLPQGFTAWDIGTPLSNWAFAGFKTAATVLDAARGLNRTFGVVSFSPNAPYNHTGDEDAVVELVGPASPAAGLCPSAPLQPGPGGGLRLVQLFPGGSAGTFEADGSLRVAETVNNPSAGSFYQTAFARDVSFDAEGCASWTVRPLRTLAAVNVSANNSESLMIRGSMVAPQIPTTSGNFTIFFDADRGQHGGFHLGAVLPQADGSPGTAWAWRASPWGAWLSVDNITTLQPGNISVNLRFLNASTVDGRFGGDDPSVNFAGSRAMADGANVFYGFYGEGWQQSEANQMLHWHETGLFLGQFGIPGGWVWTQSVHSLLFASEWPHTCFCCRSRPLPRRKHDLCVAAGGNHQTELVRLL